MVGNTLEDSLKALDTPALELQLITNRGVKVWPQGFPETFCVDHWRCRFMSATKYLDFEQVLGVQKRLLAEGFDIVKTENLYNFDGKAGFAAVHG